MGKKHRNWRPPEVKKVPVQDEGFGVKPLPDYVYKYRANRVNPAEQRWGVGGTASYLPRPEALIIPDKGIFIQYRGWGEYPAPLFNSRCYSPVEVIYAMLPVKRMTINGLRFLTTLHKKGRLNRLLFYFNDICDMMLMPFYLRDEYYSGPAKQVKSFLKTLLMGFRVDEKIADRTAEVFSLFIETDNAYRWRIQDLAGETSIEALTKDFPKELDRLFVILAQREVIPEGGQELVNRFKTVSKVLKWIWRIPWMRNRLRKAILAVNLEELKLDEADFYHMILYGDYNPKGMDMNERLKVYEKYHGPDQTKWPARILIKNVNNG